MRFEVRFLLPECFERVLGRRLCLASIVLCIVKIGGRTPDGLVVWKSR